MSTQEMMYSRDFGASSHSSKRRLPPGGLPVGPSYGAKSRRREEGQGRRTGGSNQYSGGPGEGREGVARPQKDELIDQHIVDRTRHGSCVSKVFTCASR